ncbi:hypothetical protein QBC37DRAFT_430390 [Rhypophila decipiens]|uniref:NB-ARC domain-containing protein n=1 Tax=Rhypophila decipiens TaxID=261697 RepID=A0AAN6Y3J6_9PEZI|nr:hypothetical protein QBC37DRAFT_430390 [Rhypophila decipiens]
MILDSADDRDVFYGEIRQAQDSKPLLTYLPQSRNGYILVTTRDKDRARRLAGGDNILEVGPMVYADALSLLDKKLGPVSDMNTVVELVRLLDFIIRHLVSTNLWTVWEMERVRLHHDVRKSFLISSFTDLMMAFVLHDYGKDTCWKEDRLSL